MPQLYAHLHRRFGRSRDGDDITVVDARTRVGGRVGERGGVAKKVE
jgi:hypothetical protein